MYKYVCSDAPRHGPAMENVGILWSDSKPYIKPYIRSASVAQLHRQSTSRKYALVTCAVGPLSTVGGGKKGGEHAAREGRDRTRAPPGIPPNTVIFSKRLCKTHFRDARIPSNHARCFFASSQRYPSRKSAAVVDDAGRAHDMEIRFKTRNPPR